MPELFDSPAPPTVYTPEGVEVTGGVAPTPPAAAPVDTTVPAEKPPRKILPNTGRTPQYRDASGKEVPGDSAIAAQMRLEANVADPLLDLTSDDLASLAKQSKGKFSLKQTFESRPELHSNPAIVQKVADAFTKYADETPIVSLPTTKGEWWEAAKGLGTMAKGYGKTLAYGVPAFLAANVPGVPEEIRKDAELAEAEIISGNRVALQGLANIAEGAAGKAARFVGISKSLKDLSAQERVEFFMRHVEKDRQLQKISEGTDEGFMAPDKAYMEELAKSGRVMNQENVAEYGAGSPLALELFGKSFHAAGKVVGGTAKLVAPKIVAGTVPTLGNAATATGGNILQGGSWLADKGLQATQKVAPLGGAAAGAIGMTSVVPGAGGGVVGAGLGLGAGKQLAKGLQPVRNFFQAAQQVGKEVAGKEAVTMPISQLAKDVLEAAPMAGAEIGKGLSFDAVLSAAAETPEEQQGVGVGALFGLAGAGMRGGLHVVSGQLIAPRAYGSGTPYQSHRYFPALDALHNNAYAAANEGTKTRVNALRGFVRLFNPEAEVILAGKDPAAYQKALVDSGMTPEQASLYASQEGFHAPRFRDAGGNERQLLVFRDVDSAPHEVKHAMDEVLGANAARARWMGLKRFYSEGEWNAFGEKYARALSSEGRAWDPQQESWQSYLADSSGWGRAEAAEMLARRAVGGEGPVSQEQMQQALATVQDSWREVLGPDRVKALGELYTGSEISAESWDSLFKHTGPTMQEPPGLIAATARQFATVLSAIGVDPLSGRFSEMGLPLRYGATETGKAETAVSTKGATAKPTAPLVAPRRAAVPAAAQTQPERDRASDQRIVEAAPDTFLEGAEQSVREMAGALAEAAATRQGVVLEYRSAPAGQEGGAGPAAASALGGITRTVTRPVRRRIIEAARNLPEEAREMISKVFVPFKLRNSRKGLQAGGWAPQVVAANAQKLAEFVAQNPTFRPDLFGADGAYPVDVAKRTFTVDGWRSLLDDVQTFSKNQGAGATGSGQPLVVPKTPGYYEPPVRPEVPLETLDQARADVINRLFGFKRQSTDIVASESKIPLNLVGQRVSEATMPGRVTDVGGPEFGGQGGKSAERAQKLGITGEKVRETNPFAAELEAQPNAPSMIEAFQWLNLEHMKRVEIAAEQPQVSANSLTLTAGFKPMENERVQFAVRTDEPPKNTVKAYKLFRVKPSQPGKLFPLFANTNQEVPIGTWLDAEVGKTKMAVRPGWHAGDLPVARHIGSKGPSGKVEFQAPDMVWAEVDMAADKNWQQEALVRAKYRKDGTLIPRTAEIRDEIPKDGYYRYKTNPNMEGEWLISGAMKVNRLLGDAEVTKILTDKGVEPMPRKDGEFDFARWGLQQEARTQFRPSDHPDAITGAATRDDKTGKIYEGVMHFESNLKYLEDHPELRNGREMDDPATPLQAWNKLPNTTDGFVTKTGRFLDRAEAEQHALKINQLKETQRGMGGLESDYLRANAQFKPGGLRADETKGKDNVRRFTYYDGDKKVGTARLLGSMIGDIEVVPALRRKGYGTAILEDLVSKGGNAAFAGSREGAAMMRKAGAKELNGKFTFQQKDADQAWLDSIDETKYAAKGTTTAAANTPEMLFEAKAKSNAFKKHALPHSAAGEEINIVHLSDTPGLKVIDPAKMGSGKATPRDMRGESKSYWFVEKSPLGQDENIFGTPGKNAYGTTIRGERMYDLRGDKEDVLGYFTEPNRSAADKRLQEAGYAGVVMDTADQRQVVMLFKGAKVTDLGQTKGGDKAPKGILHSEMVQFAAPNEKDGRKIKAAIVWDPKTGKHWEGAMHFLALQKATAEGVKPQELGQLTQGFIDVAGNKLSREEAFVRARELQQLKADPEVSSVVGKTSKNMGQLVSEETQFKPAELKDFSDEKTIGEALKSEKWAIVTWNQEALGAATAEANIKANDGLQKRLNEAGYDYTEVKGSYEGVDQGRNFLITGISAEDALALGREGKQDSVITPEGLVYSDGTYYENNSANTVIGEEAKKLPGWSQVPGGPAFSLGLDFSNKKNLVAKVAEVDPQSQLFTTTAPEKKPLLASSQIATMGVAALRDYYPEAVVPNRVRNQKGKLVDPEVTSDHKNSPLYKRAKDEAEAVQLFKRRLVEEHNKMKDNPDYQSGLKWYSEFVPMLKEHFGEDAPILAELLAATSPNNQPGPNFRYAVDALQNHKAGKYEHHVKKFFEGVAKIEDGSWKPWLEEKLPTLAAEEPKKITPAKFLMEWTDANDAIPMQSNGKRFGMHSFAVLKVIARRWLTLNSGPKTINFNKNLLGTGHEATIDVWADRTLRRIGYEEKGRWRITPNNSTGIPDADFYFGQKVFRAAAEELGILPDALQGGMWFAEKNLWAERNWGRLDLGDYRTEMKAHLAGPAPAKVKKTRKGKNANQAELPIVTPRNTPQ